VGEGEKTGQWKTREERQRESKNWGRRINRGKGKKRRKTERESMKWGKEN
jgi:hypothetical protein